MGPGVTRRGWLGKVIQGAATAAATGALTTGSTRRGRAQRTPEHSDAFDPTVHGFGFRNWGTSGSMYAEHDHDTVDEEQVRRVIRRRWDEPAARHLGVDVSDVERRTFDAIAKQLYVSINQGSATNGHCYGMVFAAQQYYDRPETVPLDRSVASELTHPEAPVDQPSTAPVGREIDLFHVTQFLNFDAWIGRRAMLRPSWIDYERQLDALTTAVDVTGTAGITLFETYDRPSHQVLVYDYERSGDRTRLFVYDPNYPAARYEKLADPLTVTVDQTGSRPTVTAYTDAYDQLLFNRRDRRIAEFTGQRDPTVAVDEEAVNPDVAFSIVEFLVESRDVSLTVVGPDDRPVGRDTASLVDRRQSEYDLLRYRYGFEPGRYLLRVVGDADGEYVLTGIAADRVATRLDAEREATISAGSVHTYVADVPASGSGELRRADESTIDWPRVAGGAGVGLAACAAGVHGIRRYRSGRTRDE